MEENVFWELFLDTGSPEAYLLFKKSRREARPPNDKDNHCYI